MSQFCVNPSMSTIFLDFYVERFREPDVNIPKISQILRRTRRTKNWSASQLVDWSLNLRDESESDSVTRFGGLPAKWRFFKIPGGQKFWMAGGG